MSKKNLIFLGLLGLTVIFILCASMHWRAIEQDIAQCSNKILTDANYTSVTADSHDRGRSIVLTGVVTSQVNKQAVAKLLQEQCHITEIENSIKVIVPKPDTPANLNIQLNNSGYIITGQLGNKNEIEGIITALHVATDGKNIKQNIGIDKKVIPANLAKYLKLILPEISQVDHLNLDLKPNIVKLKGNVANQAIKFEIDKRVSEVLKNKARLINLLVVNQAQQEHNNEVDATAHKPLNAIDCQQELNSLLAQSMVHFNSGSAVIKDDSLNLLNQLSATTRSCQNVQIEIIGHTDKTGNEANNILLSKARASAVAQHLLSTGVQIEKISANGVGSSQPIASNETAQGRSQNRRIEFRVHSQQE
ncbi:MAG TPA: OmpA family protein [Oceanospirillales bacterium]|nr:OmpA family protein [Oceanospirillales bacterium]